jgi:hypothetical protein
MIIDKWFYKKKPGDHPNMGLSTRKQSTGEKWIDNSHSFVFSKAQKSLFSS